ncbi:MAG: dihydroorotate dehydrogenase [Oscillospiraceae bacterium]|nr:dihydroorotate dehydrogenase [Oscillospiraceae bacterium]
MPDLAVDICGVKLKNPVIAASGTFGFGEEFAEYMDVSKLGGICSKGLTLHPRAGNPGVRMWETSGGMLNSVGLQNPGVAAFIEKELIAMRNCGTAVIANLGGGTLDEYIEGAKLLDKADIDILELNISCPNVKQGGIAFGIKCTDAKEVVSAVRAVFHGVMMVKLSPNAEDITQMAIACVEAGADALSLINTIKAMSIDVFNRRPMFRNTVAGLSGPAVKPIALRMVYDVCKAVDVPVIGIGGIMTGMDAAEFIMAGAAAVQIGTANFTRPDASLIILRELEDFMIKQGIESLGQIEILALQCKCNKKNDSRSQSL